MDFVPRRDRPAHVPKRYKPLIPGFTSGNVLEESSIFTVLLRWSSVVNSTAKPPTQAHIFDIASFAIERMIVDLKEAEDLDLAAVQGVAEAAISVRNVRVQKYKAFIDIGIPSGCPLGASPSLFHSLMHSLAHAFNEAVAFNASFNEDHTTLKRINKVKFAQWKVAVAYDVPSDEDCRTVFCGKLYGATEDQLRELFVDKARIEPEMIRMPRHQTGQGKEIAYCIFADRETAAAACEAVRGCPVADSFGIKSDLFVNDEVVATTALIRSQDVQNVLDLHWRPPKVYDDEPADEYNQEWHEPRPTRDFNDRPARNFHDRPRRDFNDRDERPRKNYGKGDREWDHSADRKGARAPRQPPSGGWARSTRVVPKISYRME